MQEETSPFFYEKAFKKFAYQSTIKDHLKRLIHHPEQTLQDHKSQRKRLFRERRKEFVLKTKKDKVKVN